MIAQFLYCYCDRGFGHKSLHSGFETITPRSVPSRGEALRYNCRSGACLPTIREQIIAQYGGNVAYA